MQIDVLLYYKEVVSFLTNMRLLRLDSTGNHALPAKN